MRIDHFDNGPPVRVEIHQVGMAGLGEISFAESDGVKRGPDDHVLKASVHLAAIPSEGLLVLAALVVPDCQECDRVVVS